MSWTRLDDGASTPCRGRGSILERACSGRRLSAPYDPAVTQAAGAPTPITPLAVPRDVPGVVFVGGVFDPPHLAHVLLPSLARDHLAPDAWLVFVPAARSPLKDAPPCVPDADRLAMLRLAIRDTPRSSLWTDEIDRANAALGVPSYWIDTLGRAREILGPDIRLRFVIGADQAGAFHRWRRPRDILALAEPIVLLRPPLGTTAAFADVLRGTGAWSEAELPRWIERVYRAPLMETSATSIRRSLAEGISAARGLDLHPGVAAYIREHRLYS